MLVSIITPTTGHPKAHLAVASVLGQSHQEIEYLLVVDGPEHEAKVRAGLGELTQDPRLKVIVLPTATGPGGWNGHRIYAAYSFLTSGAYLAFLDEDNFYDPEHIARLVDRVRERRPMWAYALRKIIDAQGRFVARDDCESLGRWPSWEGDKQHLVDVSCFFLRQDVAAMMAPAWYVKREYHPDRRLTQHLLKIAPEVETSGYYSVNYRAGSSAESVKPAFFIKGNQVMADRFPQGLPWCQDPRPLPQAGEDLEGALIASGK